MKTIDDALNLRRRIFAAFELAESAPSEAERRRWLTFAVVGGGPTGCEVAGQIAELARRTLTARTFARSTPRAPSCSSSTPAQDVLASFGDRLSRKATDRARAHRGRDSHRNACDEHRRRRHGRRVSERSGAHRDAHGRLGSRRAGLAACAHPGRGGGSGVRSCGPGRRRAPTARCRATLRSSSSATR